MKESPFQFTIGRGRWDEEIRYYCAELNPGYWARFRPLRAEEITTIEKNVGRSLPDDFKEFLRVFGCGNFPERYGGNIYDPDDFIDGCHGNLSFVLGSSKWASRDDQRRFYVTRGAFNPAPKKYTTENLIFEEVNLLDLLQIGSDGLCCYHQVYVGERPGPLGYCLLTPEETMEDEAPTFSEGLKTILTHHWFRGKPSED